MHNLPPFLGLEKELSDPASALFTVIPIPYEATTSYGKGTALAPAAIYEASLQVEYLDDIHLDMPCKAGISNDLSVISALKNAPADLKNTMLKTVHKAAADALKSKKFPLGIGGEHTITVPLIKAAKEHTGGDITIVSIDAHADLRDSYEGTPYSHACAMKRALEYASSLIVIGVRSLCPEELETAQKYNTKIIFGHEIYKNPSVLEKTADSLAGKNVYLTIDMDGLSTAVVPDVGTPEPGGIDWYPLLSFIDKLASVSSLIGADIVELKPSSSLLCGTYAAAKLAYKIMGAYYRNKK